MHMDPNPLLIEECRKFVKLAEFFGTSEAPKLEVKIVHLLFMLDFVTGLILRRFYLVHKLVMRSGNTEENEEVGLGFEKFKNELGSGNKKDKLYQPKHDSGKKGNERHGMKPTLIGFNELQDSELLQGSSLLKSINNSKNNYDTSEEVNALMNSSFLVNTLEALKKKKQSEQKIKLETLNNKDDDKGTHNKSVLI